MGLRVGLVAVLSMFRWTGYLKGFASIVYASDIPYSRRGSNYMHKRWSCTRLGSHAAFTYPLEFLMIEWHLKED